MGRCAVADEVRVYTREQEVTKFIGPRKEDRAKRFAVEHYRRTGDKTIMVTRVQETEMMNAEDVARFKDAGWY